MYFTLRKYRESSWHVGTYRICSSLPFIQKGFPQIPLSDPTFFTAQKMFRTSFKATGKEKKREDKVKYVIKSEHINNSRKHQLYVEREESKNTQVH